MELNWILIWICGISSAVNLVATLQQKDSPAWGWRAVLAAILILLGVLWITVPEIAGYLIGPVWFLFAFLPGMLLKRTNDLLAQRKHRRAYWAARLAGWLHPGDGWPQQTQIVRAISLFEQGKTKRASALLDKLSGVKSSLGLAAKLIQTQQTGEWQSLLNEIETRFTPAAVLRDETLFLARTQAFGELGRPTEMLATLISLFAGRARLSPMTRAIVQMRAAALSGRVADTERQLGSLNQTFPPDVHTYWRLTAQQVAGVEGVDEAFRQLQSTASPYLQPLITRRLAQPLPVFDSSTANPQTNQILAALSEQIQRDADHGTWTQERLSKPWATWGIAAVLVAAFIVEMLGGSTTPEFSLNYLSTLISRTENSEHLVNLGALIVPQDYTPGEWWRVLTAGYLHFGPLHLGLNLLGLLVLAPRLERAWGAAPMIVCYLITTVTSMALAPHVMSVPPDEVRILVGASGGIMGLLGGLVGMFVVQWLRHRTDQTRKPLMFLVLIIILQTSFDLSTPNVSFACHSLGVATGIVFGAAWTWLRRTQQA